jgi:hypothetical protein
MNVSPKGKVVAGCNWAMALSGVILAGYVFAQLLAVPPQTPFVPAPRPAAAAPAVVPGQSAPVTTPAAGNAVGTAAPAGGQAAAGRPAAAAAPSSGAVAGPSTAAPGTSKSRRDLEATWGSPVYQAPAVPIAPLYPSALPPGVGKDF